MSKEKVTSEISDAVEHSKRQEGLLETEVISCGSCNQEDTVLWGKVTVVKHSIIDKLAEGITNGHNIDYLHDLSKIYSNLSF